jgi:hypothetical protein
MPSSAAIMPAETSGPAHDIVHEGRQARGGTATPELARQQAARREPAIMLLEAGLGHRGDGLERGDEPRCRFAGPPALARHETQADIQAGEMRGVAALSQSRPSQGWCCSGSIPVVAGVGSGRPLANLSASARILCFERLTQGADDGPVAAGGTAVARRRRPTLPSDGRDGLIARFVDVVDARQGSPRSARAHPPGIGLAAFLAAYVRAVGGGSRSKRHGADAGAGARESLAA